jgi:hypothetical protein
VISLKPQDIVVLLKLSLEHPASISQLAAALGISASEVHASLTRSSAADLLDFDTRRPRAHNLLEFLEHGIRYAFVSRRGEITRGFPTAFSASPLRELLVNPLRGLNLLQSAAANAVGLPVIDAPDVPLVWPHPDGAIRGESLEPLYPSVVDASRRDPALYECMALVDALRVGRARERNLAIDLLTKKVRGL